jgi:DNA invertase Pin-like site-specific DNA recombinase
MIIGYARVSTTEQNLGLPRVDVKPEFDASVDVTDARYGQVNGRDVPARRYRIARSTSHAT